MDVRNTSERGTALVLAIFLGVGLMALTLVSLEMSKSHASTQRAHEESFAAKQIAQSGAAQALAQIKHGGIIEPHSGNGANPVWVSFAGGEFYYYSAYDSTNDATTIRAWDHQFIQDVFIARA